MKQPLAHIHPEAKIANDVEISPFVSIAGDVVIDEGTWIGPNVTIMDGARIGKNCKVFPSSVISAIPQDLKFAGEQTTAEIGDNTVIREGVTIHRGTVDRMKTVIGANCLLMTYVHIAHDCIIGDNCILAGYAGLAGHNVLEDFVIMEGKTGTQQFIRIGAHAFIAGGGLVRKDVPPYVKAAREPLVYAGVNTVGLKRRGFSEKAIKTIEEVYRIIFVKNNSIRKALNDVRKEIPESEERTKIISFIEGADKGIMKGIFSNGQ